MKKTRKGLSRREFSGLALSGMAPLVAQLAASGAVRASQSGAPSDSADAPAEAAEAARFERIYPGIWKATLGSPEVFTPVKNRFRPPAEGALRQAGAPSACPLAGVSGQLTDRGYIVTIPLAADEQVYGFGLQFLSFAQRMSKKTVRTNADPRADSGDSHAPAPFYVTTGGYGVLIDSSRYVSFYVARMPEEDAARILKEEPPSAAKVMAQPVVPKAHSGQTLDEPSELIAEIPLQAGTEIYIFGGPSMRQAVERYNLFSGGGCLPPRWGLGLWYRCQSKYTQQQVKDLAAELRRSRVPCDVLGLEPGWQTHSYSCTFVWHPERFPDPPGMIRELQHQNFHLNLWEHAFTHPTSPLYRSLQPMSGDYEVFGGLVPDFLDPQARQTFGEFQDKQHVEIGVSGFKLDECDNSDFTGGWSFPEASRFPSGVDGEQMHSHFGLGFQAAIDAIFTRRNTRAYHLVRSSNALAAPFPFVLYSDLYDHPQYIRAIANSGFCGLLWAAEVRDAQNDEDLIRRLQTACLCALAQVDAWYLKNPPWKQVNTQANNSGHFAPDWQKLEAQCREIVELRMRLVPYLHAAFVRYHEHGTPPFRALVLDYPADRNTWDVDDQFMVGDHLLAAPVVAGVSRREVYLPAGEWIDFWTGHNLKGGQKIKMDVPLNIVPLFVQSGTLLPLAHPTLHAGDPGARQITVRVYGQGHQAFTLYEDDDRTLGALHGKYNRLTLTWDRDAHKGRAERTGQGKYPRYEIKHWEPVPGE